MKTLIRAAAFSLFVFAATPSQAVLIDNSTPIPDSFVLLNFNNSGLDWVYAGPLGPNEWGPGQIEPASYRSAEGWRTATAAEWLSHPLYPDFIKPGFTVIDVPAFDGWNDHSKYLFASEYWSGWHHVDLADFSNGNVTDGVNNPGVLGNHPDTIYVRNSVVGAIPEPSTWAMMLLGFAGLGFMAYRRRNDLSISAT